MVQKMPSENNDSILSKYFLKSFRYNEKYKISAKRHFNGIIFDKCMSDKLFEKQNNKQRDWK